VSSEQFVSLISFLWAIRDLLTVAVCLLSFLLIFVSVLLGMRLVGR